MTDKEQLIELLQRFGIRQAESLNTKDAFAVFEKKTYTIEGFDLNTDTDVQSQENEVCEFNQPAYVGIVKARLRQVSFIFNDDGSFKELY